MSIIDYDKWNKYTSSFTFYKSQDDSNENTSGVLISGVRLIIHPSINAKDGEIEIY